RRVPPALATLRRVYVRDPSGHTDAEEPRRTSAQRPALSENSMSPSHRVAALFAAALLTLAVRDVALGQEKPTRSAVTPSARDDEKWWTERLASVNERVKRGDVDLLFIGDSITQGWESNGKAIWEKTYGQRRAVNLGFSGDRTEHVLYRLDHGNV